MPGEAPTPVGGQPTQFTTSVHYDDEFLTRNGVLQTPAADYTYVGLLITFTSAPDVTDALFIRGNATSSTATAPTNAAVYDFTADNLLRAIRDAAYSGVSKNDWPDVQLLRLVNRQIQEYLLPFILRTRKEDFITSTDQPLVNGTAAYRLPASATAARVRAIQLVDASGNPYSRLVEIPLETAINVGTGSLGNPVQGTPTGYYFRGNQVVLIPTPAQLSGISLRIFYPARPSTLALVSSFIQIVSFPAGAASGFFRLGIGTTVPSAYGATVACDLVQNQPGFDILYTGSLSAITAGTFGEFPGTLPVGLAVGDWICLAGTAPVITGAIAEVTTGCLVNKVVLEMLSSKSDGDGFKRRGELLKKSEELARSLLLPNRNTANVPHAGAGALHRFRRGGCAS